MISETFGTQERPAKWDVAQWSRIPHPVSGQIENGPESDVVIQTSNWRFVIEAKWTSDISVHKHGQTQIEMRAYQATLGGIPRERSGVFVIAPSPERYDCAKSDTSIFRRYFTPEEDGYAALQPAVDLNAKAITWEQLAEIFGDRSRPNLRQYLEWRLSLIRA